MTQTVQGEQPMHVFLQTSEKALLPDTGYGYGAKLLKRKGILIRIKQFNVIVYNVDTKCKHPVFELK